MTQAFVNVLLGEGQSNNVPEMDDWGTYILSIEIDARHIEPQSSTAVFKKVVVTFYFFCF